MLKRLRNKLNRNRDNNRLIKTRRKMQFEALEPRILLSADLGLEHPDPLPSHGQPLAIIQPLAGDIGATPSSAVASERFFAHNVDSQSSRLIQKMALEVIVVDSSVPDYQQLINQLNGELDDSVHYETYLLDSDSDGMEQISEILKNHNDLSALHIFSHGSSAQLTLGQSTLDIDTLQQYQGKLASWGAALGEQGDILLYGCSVAAGEVGIDFIESIAGLSSADVAASTDVTGAAARGGDWQLEEQHGELNATVLSARNYHHLLEAISGTAADETLTSVVNQNDTLTGKGGNDRYQFQDNWGVDSVVEKTGEGSDTLDFSAVNANLSVQFAADGSVSVSAGSNSLSSVSNIEKFACGKGTLTIDAAGLQVSALTANQVTIGGITFELLANPSAITITNGVLSAALQTETSSALDQLQTLASVWADQGDMRSKLPLTNGQTLAEIVDVPSIFQNYVDTFFNSAKDFTLDVSDAASAKMNFNSSFSSAETVTVIDLASAQASLRDNGLNFATGATFDLTTQLNAVFDLTVAVGGSASDAVIFSQLEVAAQANSAIHSALNVGVLETQVNAGSVNFTAAVAAQTGDALQLASANRVANAQKLGASGTGTFGLTLPIAVESGLLATDGSPFISADSTISIGDDVLNLFALNTAPPTTMPDWLRSFTRITPQEIQDQLVALSDWLQNLESSSNYDALLPLLGDVRFGDVVDFDGALYRQLLDSISDETLQPEYQTLQQLVTTTAGTLAVVYDQASGSLRFELNVQEDQTDQSLPFVFNLADESLSDLRILSAAEQDLKLSEGLTSNLDADSNHVIQGTDSIAAAVLREGVLRRDVYFDLTIGGLDPSAVTVTVEVLRDASNSSVDDLIADIQTAINSALTAVGLKDGIEDSDTNLSFNVTIDPATSVLIITGDPQHSLAVAIDPLREAVTVDPSVDLSLDFDWDLAAGQKGTLSSTAPVHLQQSGRLSEDCSFDLEIDGHGTVTVIVASEDTAANGSIADLIVDINNALNVALESESFATSLVSVEAADSSSGVKLSFVSTAPISLLVSDAARDQLGLNAGDYSFAATRAIATAALGTLQNDLAFRLRAGVDTTFVDGEVTITVAQAASFTTMEQLVALLQTKVDATALLGKIIVGNEGNRLTFSLSAAAAETWLNLFAATDSAVVTELGFANGQSAYARGTASAVIDTTTSSIEAAIDLEFAAQEMVGRYGFVDLEFDGALARGTVVSHVTITNSTGAPTLQSLEVSDLDIPVISGAVSADAAGDTIEQVAAAAASPLQFVLALSGQMAGVTPSAETTTNLVLTAEDFFASQNSANLKVSGVGTSQNLLDTIDFNSVVSALEQSTAFFDAVRSNPVMTNKIALLGTQGYYLNDFNQAFSALIADLRDQESAIHSLQQLHQTISDLFALSTFAFTIDQPNLLRFQIQMSRQQNQQLGLPFDLSSDGLLAGEYAGLTLVDRSATVDLQGQSTATLNLDIAIDYSDPLDIQSYLYDQTGVQLTFGVHDSGRTDDGIGSLNFTALVGQGNVVVSDGQYDLSGLFSAEIAADRLVDQRINLKEFEPNAVAVNLSGTADVSLALSESRLADDARLEIEISDLGDVANSSTVVIADGLMDIYHEKNPIHELLLDSDLIIDGLDRHFAALQQSLTANLTDLGSLPLIGDQILDGLSPILDTLAEIRSALRSQIENTMQGLSGNESLSTLAENMATMLTSIFGDDGLGLLAAGSEIVPRFLNAAGEIVDSIEQAVAFEYGFSTGSRYTKTLTLDLGLGVDDLSLDELLPNIGLDLTGDVVFEAWWNLIFAFGFDLNSGFYINADSLDAGGDEVPEFSVGVEARIPDLTGGMNAGVLETDVSDGIVAPVTVSAANPLKEYATVPDAATGGSFHDWYSGMPSGSFSIDIELADGTTETIDFNNIDVDHLSALLTELNSHAGMVLHGVTARPDFSNLLAPRLVFTARDASIVHMTINDGEEFGFADEQQEDQNSVLGFGKIPAVGDVTADDIPAYHQASTLIDGRQVIVAEHSAPEQGRFVGDVYMDLTIDGTKLHIYISADTLVELALDEVDPEDDDLLSALNGAINSALRAHNLAQNVVEAELVDGKIQLIAHQDVSAMSLDISRLQTSALHLLFEIDVKDPLQDDGRLGLSDLLGNKGEIYKAVARAAGEIRLFVETEQWPDFDLPLPQVSYNLRADMAKTKEFSGSTPGSSVLPEFSGFSGLPDLPDWPGLDDFPWQDKPQGLTLHFENITFDLNSMLTDLIQPLTQPLQQALKPISSILGGAFNEGQSFLEKGVPVLKEASEYLNSPSSWLGFSGNKGSLETFWSVVNNLYSLIGELDKVSGLNALALGCWVIDVPLKGSEPASSEVDPKKAVKYPIPCEVDEAFNSIWTAQNKEIIDQFHDQLEQGLNDALGIPEPQEIFDSVMGSADLQLKINDFSAAGINYSLLETGNIFNLLIGEPFDMIQFDLPKVDLKLGLNVGFGYDGAGESIGFRVKGGLDVRFDLSMGYDSSGYDQISASNRAGESVDPQDVFDGVYFTGSGLTLNANFSGGSSVDIETPSFCVDYYFGEKCFPKVDVFDVSASVGLNTSLRMALIDPNGDGKLRVNELDEVFNFSSLPMVFDVSDHISGGFDMNAVVMDVELVDIDAGVGFSVTDMIGSVLGNPQRQQPVLAEMVDGALRINAGLYDYARLAGDVDDRDGARVFVTGDSSRVTVKIGSVEQNFDSVSKIIAYGSAGDDLFDLSAVDGVAVEIYAGAGDDILKSGSGDDRLFGEDGDDIVFTGAGDDTLSGGAGNDTLAGQEGDDHYLYTAPSWGRDVISEAPELDNDLIDFSSLWDNLTVNMMTTGTVIAASSSQVVIAGSTVETIRTGHGDDYFQIAASPDQPLILQGQSGSDVYLAKAGTAANVKIDDNAGGAETVGHDELIVAGHSGSDRVGLTNSEVFLGTGGQVIYGGLASGLERIRIETYAGDDKIYVQSTTDGIRHSIDGGADNDIIGVGYDLVGDQKNVNEIAGSEGSGALLIDGGAGVDQFLLADDTDSANNNHAAGTAGQLSANMVTGLGMAVGVNYTAFEELSLTLADDGDDDFVVHSAAANKVTVHGNGGDDHITIAGAIDSTLHVYGDKGADTITINEIQGWDSRSIAEGGQDDIVDGGQGGDHYELALPSTALGVNYLNISDSGTNGVDQLVYKGSGSNDFIQLDTVYNPALSTTEREFSRNRWQGYGQHQDGLIVAHFAGLDSPYQQTDLENSDDLTAVTATNLTAAEHLLIVNYASVDGVKLFGGAGDDTFVSDDTSAQIDLFGNEGDDEFYVGSVLATQTVVVEGTLIDVVTQITHGARFEGTRYFGGDGDDYFEVNHNVADINLFGDNGDDTFFVKALLTLDDQGDLVDLDSNTVQVSAAQGEGSYPDDATHDDTRAVDVDTLVYVENANINIDGGSGFDAVSIVGTALSDTFYVYVEVDENGNNIQRIYGAGLKLRELVNIERLQLLTGGGDDTIYLYGVNMGEIGDMVIDAGSGADTIYIGGPEQTIIQRYPASSGQYYTHVDGYDSSVAGAVDGMLFYEINRLDRLAPYAVNYPSRTETITMAASYDISAFVSPVIIKGGSSAGLSIPNYDRVIINNSAGPAALVFSDNVISKKNFDFDRNKITLHSAGGAGDLPAVMLGSAGAASVQARQLLEELVVDSLSFSDRYYDKALLERLAALTVGQTELFTIAAGASYFSVQTELSDTNDEVSAYDQVESFATTFGLTTQWQIDVIEGRSYRELIGLKKDGVAIDFSAQHSELQVTGALGEELTYRELTAVSLKTTAELVVTVEAGAVHDVAVIRSDQMDTLAVSGQTAMLHFSAIEDVTVQLSEDDSLLTRLTAEQAQTALVTQMVIDNDHFVDGRLTIQGGNKNDRITILESAVETIVHGGDGNDRIEILPEGTGTTLLNSIGSTLILHGDAGHDQIIVDDSKATADTTATLEKQTLEHVVEFEQLSRLTDILSIDTVTANENTQLAVLLEQSAIPYGQAALDVNAEDVDGYLAYVKQTLLSSVESLVTELEGSLDQAKSDIDTLITSQDQKMFENQVKLYVRTRLYESLGGYQGTLNTENLTVNQKGAYLDGIKNKILDEMEKLGVKTHLKYRDYDWTEERGGYIDWEDSNIISNDWDIQGGLNEINQFFAHADSQFAVYGEPGVHDDERALKYLSAIESLLVDDTGKSDLYSSLYRASFAAEGNYKLGGGQLDSDEYMYLYLDGSAIQSASDWQKALNLAKVYDAMINEYSGLQSSTYKTALTDGIRGMTSAELEGLYTSLKDRSDILGFDWHATSSQKTAVITPITDFSIEFDLLETFYHVPAAIAAKVAAIQTKYDGLVTSLDDLHNQLAADDVDLQGLLTSIQTLQGQLTPSAAASSSEIDFMLTPVYNQLSAGMEAGLANLLADVSALETQMTADADAAFAALSATSSSTDFATLAAAFESSDYTDIGEIYQQTTELIDAFNNYQQRYLSDIETPVAVQDAAEKIEQLAHSAQRFQAFISALPDNDSDGVGAADRDGVRDFDFDSFRDHFIEVQGQIQRFVADNPDYLKYLRQAARYGAQIASLQQDLLDISKPATLNALQYELFASALNTAQEQLDATVSRLAAITAIKVDLWWFEIDFQVDYSKDPEYLKLRELVDYYTGKKNEAQSYYAASKDTPEELLQQLGTDDPDDAIVGYIDELRLLDAANEDLKKTYDGLLDEFNAMFTVLQKLGEFTVDVLAESRGESAAAGFVDSGSMISSLKSYRNDFVIHPYSDAMEPFTQHTFANSDQPGSVVVSGTEQSYRTVTTLTLAAGLADVSIHAGYDDVEELILYGGAGNDQIQVADTLGQADSHVQIFSGAGDDTVTVSSKSAAASVDGVVGELTIDVQGGLENRLVINDGGDLDGDAAIQISNEAIVGMSQGDINYFASGGTFGGDIEITTSRGDDSIVLQSLRSEDLTVLHANSGNDTIKLLSSVDAGYLDLHGDAGNDEINAKQVDSVQLVIAGGAGDDRLDGGALDDVLFGDGMVVHRDNLSHQLIRVESAVAVEGGRDSIHGWAGNDVVVGGAGDDAGQAITAGRAATTFSSGLYGDSGDDVLLGDHGGVVRTDSEAFDDNDVYTLNAGLAGNDLLVGGLGDDVLIGGTGDDTLRGDAGNDWLLGDFGYLQRDESDQRQIVRSSERDLGGNDIIEGGSGDDILLGGATDDTLYGGYISASVDLSAATDDDILLGDNGTVVSGGSITTNQSSADGDDTLHGSEGDDIIVGGGNTSLDHLYGESGADILLGDYASIYRTAGLVTSVTSIVAGIDPSLGGRDVITGGTQADVIFGGGGDDVIRGDAGDDILLGDNGQIQLSGRTRNIETIAGGAGGSDTLNGNDGDDIVIGGAEQDTLYGDAGADVLLGDHALLTRLASGEVQRIITSDFTYGAADTLNGGDDNDILIGSGGADTLAGGAADDILMGGHATVVRNDGSAQANDIFANAADDSADTLFAGAGNDLLVADSARIVRDELDALETVESTYVDHGGNDTVHASSGDNLIIAGYGSDTISTGAGNDLILGDNGRVSFENGVVTQVRTIDIVAVTTANDQIKVEGGNNHILAGGGSDRVVTGRGDDIILGDNGQIQFNDAGVVETVETSLNFGSNDHIDSGAGRNVILGGFGGDTLRSGDGDDIIFGDNGLIDYHDGVAHQLKTTDTDPTTGGADTIHSGGGDDRVLAGVGSDRVDAGSGDDIVIGDNGNIHIEERNASVIAVSGNPHLGGRDNLHGGDGSDVLIGGADGDNLNGGYGNDHLVGDAGRATFHSGVLYQVETLDRDRFIGGADTLIDGNGSDSMFGGYAKDTFFGGFSDDLMIGEYGRLTMKNGRIEMVVRLAQGPLDLLANRQFALYGAKSELPSESPRPVVAQSVPVSRIANSHYSQANMEVEHKEVDHRHRSHGGITRSVHPAAKPTVRATTPTPADERAQDGAINPDDNGVPPQPPVPQTGDVQPKPEQQDSGVRETKPRHDTPPIQSPADDAPQLSGFVAGFVGWRVASGQRKSRSQLLAQPLANQWRWEGGRLQKQGKKTSATWDKPIVGQASFAPQRKGEARQ